jgi:hypothetical protein
MEGASCSNHELEGRVQSIASMSATQVPSMKRLRRKPSFHLKTAMSVAGEALDAPNEYQNLHVREMVYGAYLRELASP